MECVPLSGNGCANGPPMGCYLQLVGVQPGLAEEELAELLSGRRHGLPDEKHASDHVPVAAAFAFVPPAAEGEQ